MQIFGMGIASYDLTGDGYPEVYLTSQADNKLQTLTAGPGQPTYRDIARKRGVTATTPFTGGDLGASTAWHPEFQDVNNDGYIDLFVSKGNVNTEEGFALKDPSELFLGQPDGTYSERAVAAGIVSFDRAAGRLSPISTRMACSTWSRSTSGRRSISGATWAAGRQLHPRRWAIGWRSSSASRPKPRRDRRLDRSQGW